MDTTMVVLLFALTCMWNVSPSESQREGIANILGIQQNTSPQVKPVPVNRFQEFDWELSKELNSEKKGNMVISPISLKVVLAMLFEGAQGQTAKEIGEALDLTSSNAAARKLPRERFSEILRSLQTSEGKYNVTIGTHVFIDKSAKPKQSYQKILRDHYKSDMEKVDFSNATAAVSAINSWASKVTQGHIQHLITEAEAQDSIIMLLINAVYFKGLWEKPFPQNQTKSLPFHLSDTKTVQVPMMNIIETYAYARITELDAQLIRLPYLGEKFAMYVLLPNSKTGLDKLIEALGPDKRLSSYMNNMIAVNLNLFLPKFEFDFTTSLRPALVKLGIKTMFTSNANLSDIADTENGNLVVSNVFQKAGISVTENGTVAYAATVAEVVNKFGGDEDTIDFQVDHPFLFFIEDETTRTTVFVGKVTDPDKAKVHPEDPHPEKDPNNRFGTGGSDCSPYDLPEPQSSQTRFNFFDADLFKEVGAREQGNFVISPSNVKTLLGLLLEGAEGNTLSEILRAFRLDNVEQARHLLHKLQNGLQAKSPTVTVESVAQVFVSHLNTLNETYAMNIQKQYRADISPQDFSHPELTANNINYWIETRTGGLIPSLIDPASIKPDTLTILASAIFFDGKWLHEFRLEDTKDACFFSEPHFKCQTVPMMYTNEELYYKYNNQFNAHVVSIPYQDQRFSMLLMIPQKKEGIKSLNLDAARLQLPALLNSLQMYDVRLRMPRFTIDYSTELINVLTKLGLNDVFTDEANVPYIIHNKQGRVSSIVHKAKIVVNEKGTRAASASAAEVVPLMYGLDAINITADHPFYFFIYERDTMSVLFAGRVSSLGSTSPPAGLQPLSANSRPNHFGQPNQHNGKSTPRTDVQYPPTDFDSTVQPELSKIPNPNRNAF